jgi:hypothetical protein
MKPVNNCKWLIALFFIAISAQFALAQTKADVFDKNVPVTWIGVDYQFAKHIGTPTNSSVTYSPWTVVKKTDNGIVTNDEFRDSYTVQWNQLFIDEQKKYNVAKAIDRSSVAYAIDVCINANKKLTKKEFFSNNPSDFKTITETNITDAVKNYDFQGNKGLGMMFFVEGMDKGTTEEGIWVTFVNMDTKTVLLTHYVSSKSQGSGFRNYWAKPLWVALKEMNLRSWK